MPRLTRVQPVARAAARLSSSRIPPESSTRTSRALTTPASSSRVRAAAEGGVEVDEVDPLGAAGLPGERGLERVAVGGLAAGLALDEPDGGPAGDVDGGQELQTGALTGAG